MNLALLGPQYRSPNLAATMEEMGIRGPLCAITAGWQERADEVESLQQHLKLNVTRLDIYRRAEQVFENDPEFFRAYRARQNLLREHQQIYRLRLNSLMRQCLDIWELPEHYPQRDAEREHALEMVRELDRHHLEKVTSVRRRFEDQWKPRERPSVRLHRLRLKELIDSSEGVLIAGGHVAVLLNRLRLFGLKDLIAGHPIIAWAGGTMVLGRRIVLFHDKPPQGPGYAEVLERGLGLYERCLPFPDASKRLDLNDKVRLSVLASRFHPQRCLFLDPGRAASRKDGDWSFECRSPDLEGTLSDATGSRKN